MRNPAATTAALAVGAVLVVLPAGLETAAPAAAGLRLAGTVLAVAALWAGGLLGPWASASGWVLTALAVAAAPLGVVRAVATSGAVWLVAGGMIVGVAVKHSGLGERLARGLVARIGGSYGALLAGIVAVALVMAFVMPSSMGRTVLLTPVVLSLAAALGFRHGSRGYEGLVLATGTACIIPAMAVLPATVPNVVMLGAVEAQHPGTLRYFDFMAAHLPTTGLLRAALVVAIAWLLYRQRPQAAPPQDPRPLTGPQTRLLLILAAALALWATDFLHHVSPAWIAVGAAVLCVLPPRPVLPAPRLAGAVNVKALVLVAALVGLGAAVAQSGLATGLGGRLVERLPLDPAAGGAWDAVLVAALSMAVSVAVTTPGAAAVVTPLAPRLAEASGLPLEAVLMAEVMGYATALLPYQVPPLLVAMAMGGVPLRRGAKLTLAVAAASVVLSWPATIVYWRMIGLLGGG
ncbi:SLC13 family permease [Caenispirillum bisanense]|uniref:SLC13 family permease n=1 Tax=Caenispirillum bisanense TaxID=414052 RepID=UPI000BE323DB|nr:SLC13 family permease [Caenispirillum bisanense]